MSDCIYCEKSGKKSKEHIFPAFLLKKNKKTNNGIFYSNSAGGYFGADAVVKDTCIPCNTGPLSLLDAYAKSLYTAYFSRVVTHSRTIKFEFDLLLRWVLKVTFNAQRGFGGIGHHLFHLRPYMLGNGKRPESLLFLGVVMKRSLIENRWRTPNDLRACDIKIPEIELNVEIKFSHMLVINSFCFITVDFITHSLEARQRVTQYLENTIGAREIKEESTSFEFDANRSKIDHISHNIYQAAQNPRTFPESREITIDGKRIHLTGLPDNYEIKRSRIRNTKLSLATLSDANGKNSACIIFYEFPKILDEFKIPITDKNHITSEKCYASINRSKNKTYITLHDPTEVGVPFLTNSMGIEQSTKNWNLFIDAISKNGNRLFLGEKNAIDRQGITFNCIEVISINYL